MNKAWKYPYIDLWNEEKWECKISPIRELIHWLWEKDHEYDKEGKAQIDDSLWKDFFEDSCYHKKTGSMNVPAVLTDLKSRGIYYEDRELGHIRWLVIAPERTIREKKPENRMRTILVVRNMDYSDYYWAMETVEYYREYLDMVLKENVMILFAVMEEPDMSMMYSNILMEGLSIYPTDTHHVYLDLSAVENEPELEHMLAQKIQIGSQDGWKKEVISDRKIPVLNIAGIWANNKTNNFFQTKDCGNASYNKERLLFSEMGAKLAEGMSYEYLYDSLEDEALQQKLNEMGLTGRNEDTLGNRWTILYPAGAVEEGIKLPVVSIFQEVNYSNDHLIPAAIGIYSGYVRLAAGGELAVIFFAAEDPDDNDILCDILKYAARNYPIDEQRIYITGHSHNGHFTREFAYRHSDMIAAAATLGNFPGLPKPEESGEAVLCPDEKVERMRLCDMPLINISGYSECGCMYPLNQEAVNLLPGQEFMCPINFESRAESWQRRLKASGCPIVSLEEIEATKESSDYVTRKLGIPNDKSELLFIDGFEHYIVDIRNINGRYHLRMVGIENMPHMPVPSMTELSWSFMRRFARDLETGNVIERF